MTDFCREIEVIFGPLKDWEKMRAKVRLFEFYLTAHQTHCEFGLPYQNHAWRAKLKLCFYLELEPRNKKLHLPEPT